MVVPQALRVLRLKPGRKYCTVGRLAHEVGWKYQDVVARYVGSRSGRTSCLGSTVYCGLGMLTWEQTRRAEKGQGRCILRAEEGCTEATRRSEDIVGFQDEGEVGCPRLLDSPRYRLYPLGPPASSHPFDNEFYIGCVHRRGHDGKTTQTGENDDYRWSWWDVMWSERSTCLGKATMRWNLSDLDVARSQSVIPEGRGTRDVTSAWGRRLCTGVECRLRKKTCMPTPVSYYPFCFEPRGFESASAPGTQSMEKEIK